MKEIYSTPELHITCFAPRERLATLNINESMYSVNGFVNAAASETEEQPGDIFFPIIPQR